MHPNEVAHSNKAQKLEVLVGIFDEAFEFRLGAGQVIAGWDQGVAGMKVGGRRSLTIPAHLGYGNQGAGGVIKGGETLVFVVDLLNVN
jgi:peptidylprolyl isomerase